MKFCPRLAHPRLSILASIALVGALSACASRPVVSLPAANCSGLVPNAWRSGVPSADLPTDGSAGKWIAFGDAQTGQLDKANGRTADTLSIVESCEAQRAEVVKALQRPWWRFWQ
jgi:hypothetical protein